MGIGETGTMFLDLPLCSLQSRSSCGDLRCCRSASEDKSVLAL